MSECQAKKKKIVILTNNDVGLYKFRKEILEKFVSLGWDVSIVLPYGEFVDKLKELGCNYIEVDVDRRGITPLKDIKLFCKYLKIINKIKPDAVLTYTIKPNVYGGLACSLTNTPYYANITGLGTSIQTPGLISKISIFMYRMGIKCASCTFFQNKYNMDFMNKHKVCTKRQCLIPGSGVDLSAHPYCEYPSQTGEIRFLSIMRIMKDKGIYELLSCAQKIKKKYPNVTFTIAGDYDEDSCRYAVENAHKKGWVQYLGFCKDIDLLLKTHHCVINPSHHEGMSNVLLEACACGRPVIASNIPGCIETFDEDISGFGFEVKNENSLIDCVEKFINLEYRKKQNMGEKARKKIEKEFDRQIVINKYLSYINNYKKEEIKMSLYEKIKKQEESISLVGLGYVGMPIAIEFAKRGVKVIGYDLNKAKIETYKSGIDPTNEVGDDAIKNTTVEFTSDETRLRDAKFHIVAVPTPVNDDHTPDLTPVEGASRIVGRNLTKGSIVVFESTVYPGVTEDVCVPIMEKESGLKCGVDFKVGYSPERINPGDKVHRLETIVKIVSGMDEETLEEVARVYEIVVDAGVHRASCIKVAEAAKVIENSQRDINIAFMNELSIIFNKMGIDTKSVLEAAGTKWNFLKFYPGLVGGHCIGVDPYYLTYKAEQLGYHSQVILSGRRINDDMGKYVAESVVKNLIKADLAIKNAKVAILGFTFKENCPDTRNTKIIDIYNELKEYGITPIVADPAADKQEAKQLYGMEFADMSDIKDCDAVVLAVAHEQFKSLTEADFDRMFKSADNSKKVLADIKGLLDRKQYENAGYVYWRL